MSELLTWHVSGSYFESCNCESICPCRPQGDRKGGRSTFGVCDFALSWQISDGRAGEIDLSGLGVVFAGEYSDDEPGKPWRIVVYVDDRGDSRQRKALEEIFLGRAGGTTLRNYARVLGEVYAVRPARIKLDHTPGSQRIDVEDFVRVRAARPVQSDERITCGIPGHDHPGQEIRAEVLEVEDPPFSFHVSGRTGFATEFAYSSDD
jgi:hypothetical protein